MEEYLFSGLSVGGLYALLGLGLLITLRTTSALNFAQGEMSMLGAFGFYTLTVTLGLPTYAALAGAVVLAVLAGALVYNTMIFPNRRRDQETLAFITLGLKLAISGIAALVWGAEARLFPSPFQSNSYDVFGFPVSPAHFWMLIVAVTAMALITVFLHRTTPGLAMRVAAEDPTVAQLLGVNLRVTGVIAWAVAAILGTATGILFALTGFLSPYMMGLVILKAFAALVLGGMTSIPGVVVGGLLLGALEGLSAYAFAPLFQDSIALVVIILFLIVRPQGLFGSRHGWRA